MSKHKQHRVLQQEEPCLLVKKETRYRLEEETNIFGLHYPARDMEETSWSCELSGMDAQHAGQRFVDIDDMDSDYLESMGALSGHTMLDCSHGATIVGSKMQIRDRAALRFSRKSSNNNDESGGKPRRHLQNADIRSVLVIRVKSSDSETTANAAQLYNVVFDDDVCLASQYKLCSHGALQFEPATGNGVKDGIITLTINQNTVGQENDDVRNAVVAKANSHFSTPNLATKFDHVMLCLPPGTSGRWIAYGYIDSWLTVYNDEWCSYASGKNTPASFGVLVFGLLSIW